MGYTTGEKAEDFVGWVSPDGNLKVVGIATKDEVKSRSTMFKIECKICSEDLELFPNKYFYARKEHLLNGVKPCGCSKNPRWDAKQNITRVARILEKKNIKVIGYTCGFKNAHSKIDCVCDKGHKISISINNVINGKGHCCKCTGKYIPTEQEALERCSTICTYLGYTPIGFVNGYIGTKNTKFQFHCKEHGKQVISYQGITSSKRGCKVCALNKRDLTKRQSGIGYGYHPERKDEQDFLYVLNLDNRFVKVGRSFDVNDRIRNIKTPSRSGIKNIIKLRIFTATHHEVYYYEQELLEALRSMGFQHYVPWTNECFENECLFDLNNMLDNCDFEVVL